MTAVNDDALDTNVTKLTENSTNSADNTAVTTSKAATVTVSDISTTTASSTTTTSSSLAYDTKCSMDSSPDNSSSQSKSTGTHPKKDPRIFKVIVIGDSNVGKTCLTYRFCEGQFPRKVEATIGVDFREKIIKIGEEELKLWDTAGQERFRRSMVPHYYRNVHAVVYVYDMTNRETFLSLKGWLTEYSRHSLNNDQVPRVLIGNKCDLSSLIAVSSNEAQMFADSYNMPVFETSALDSSKADHVDSIFMTIAHKLKESKPMMGSRYEMSGAHSHTTHPQVLSYTAIGGHDRKEKCGC